MADEIDPFYVPFSNFPTFFLDKDTGLPLAGGVVTFYQSDQPVEMKQVYQLSNSGIGYNFIPLPNPLILNSVGQFVDSFGNPILVWGYPYDGSGGLQLYYVTIYSAGGVLQETIDGVPWVGGTGSMLNEIIGDYENQISNPTFSEVFFQEAQNVPPGSHTFACSGSNEVNSVGPNWDIITTGTGNVVVTQLLPTPASNLAIPTNPPYALQINMQSGVTGYLRQRLYHSPAFLSGKYISGSFTIATLDGIAHNLSMTINPSNSSAYTATIIQPSTTGTLNGVYTTFGGVGLVGVNPTGPVNQFNTDPANTGYVDIEIQLPAQSTIAITSVQVTFTSEAVVIPYTEQTIARQLDHLAHYYKPQLTQKPIPSYLIGWDFPNNPGQGANDWAVTAQALGGNTSFYAWDQTIIYQSVTSGVTVSQSTSGSIILTCAANCQMAMIQYLPLDSVSSLLNGRMAMNIAANCNVSAGIQATVSIWYTTGTLPSLLTPTFQSIVASLNSDGSVNTTTPGSPAWVQVPRNGNLGNATSLIENNANNYDFYDYNFNQWDVTGLGINATTTWVAVVIGTAAMTATQAINFNSVSLVKGDIATRPAPESPTETLLKCQYFYETSYALGTAPGASAAKPGVPNSILRAMNTTTSGTTITIYALAFGLNFITPKYSASCLTTFYDPVTGASNYSHVWGYTAGGSSSSADASLLMLTTMGFTFTQILSGTKGIELVGALASTSILQFMNATTVTSSGFITFHYTTDSRPGTYAN